MRNWESKVVMIQGENKCNLWSLLNTAAAWDIWEKYHYYWRWCSKSLAWCSYSLYFTNYGWRKFLMLQNKFILFIFYWIWYGDIWENICCKIKKMFLCKYFLKYIYSCFISLQNLCCRSHNFGIFFSGTLISFPL